jgi:serine O-acetyltransferase
MKNLFFLKKFYKRKKKKFFNFSEKKKIQYFSEKIFQFLFISNKFISKDYSFLENYYKKLKNEFLNLILDLYNEKEKSIKITKIFFDKLPLLHKMLILDAKAILKYDPAAKSLQEIFLSYPGFFAIALYRISNLLQKQNIPILPRLISYYAQSKTGIEIHPSASIKEKFVIDHGTGIVIGETSCIGKNVKIYHGVTLGAIYVEKNLSNKKRHPTIEDNVIIYAGSTILGGKTKIGCNSIIGGNILITNSIPNYSIVYKENNIKIKKNINKNNNFII